VTVSGAGISAIFLGAVNILALAGGTFRGASRAMRQFPDMLTIETSKSSQSGHYNLTSFDTNRLTFDQCGGGLASR